MPADFVFSQASATPTVNISLDEPERASTPGPGIFRYPMVGSSQNTSVMEEVRVVEDIIEEITVITDSEGNVVKEIIDQVRIVEETVDTLVPNDDDDDTFVVGDLSDEEEEEVRMREHGSIVIFEYAGGVVEH